MAFEETRLLDKVAYGFTGGDTWEITRVPLFSGKVARNSERTQPLWRGSAPYDQIEPADHVVVRDAFNAMQAGLHGFRFKNWADYTLTAEVIGTAAGSADETMQLIKTYTLGGNSAVRTVIKPVGQASLFEDGAPLASTTDTTTGEVTFTSTAGKVITATVEYDLPVIFADNDLQFTIQNWESHSTEISLMEDLGALDA